MADAFALGRDRPIEFRPEILPLVRLLEDASQERCLEMVVERLRAGLSHRELLTVLFFAALRGPASIAHSVFMIDSAHQLSLEMPPQERLLPLFWAAHNFKYWQTWHKDNPSRLRLPQGALPGLSHAESDFHAAMRDADSEKAQQAVVALARTEGTHSIMELLWPYAAKNCVDIGHNAIAVANCWRALPTVGAQHLEPILCWLVPRLTGPGDQWFEGNRARVTQALPSLPPGWAAEIGESGLTRELLTLMRRLETEEVCDLAVARLTEGTACAGAIWDAVHLHAGELMMRKADVGHPVHANTAANALHYAFRHSGVPETRLLVLLQAVAWQIQHRRRKLETDSDFSAREFLIDAMAAEKSSDVPEAMTGDILASLTRQPREAAQMAFTLAQSAPDSRIFHNAALRLVPAKATPDAHDVKFPIAIFEDQQTISPQWRPHLLAASVYWLQGSDKPDSPVIQQAQEAMRTLWQNENLFGTTDA